MIGVYGVISYSVAQRFHEFGVRVAMGARARHVQGIVLRRGLLLAGLGTAFGSLGAFALTRLLQSVLVEVSATDPATFLAVAAGVVAVSALACAVPARRATRVDPMLALRDE
jgi:putative ABC transport system permease protein